MVPILFQYLHNTPTIDIPVAINNAVFLPFISLTKFMKRSPSKDPTDNIACMTSLGPWSSQ